MTKDKTTSHDIRLFRAPELGEADPPDFGSVAGASGADGTFSPPAFPLGEGPAPRNSPADAGLPEGSPGQRYRPQEFDEIPAEEALTSAAVSSPEEEARRRAQSIVQEALVEAERIRADAHRVGYEEGTKQGRAALDEAVRRLEQVARELANHKRSLYEQARSQVVELAVAIADKLIGSIAETDGQIVVRVAERAIQLLTDRETLTVRVHPEDLRHFLEAKPKILQSFDGIRKLTVVDDPSVKRGGCLVQTPSAEIDARLETQIQEIIRAVRSA